MIEEEKLFSDTRRRINFFFEKFKKFMRRVDFVIQEYGNKVRRRTNTLNSDLIFLEYVSDTLKKSLSKKDREKVSKIYKKLLEKVFKRL